MHSNTVARWERGELMPRGTSLSKLAQALKTSTAYLLGETENPKREQKTEEQNLKFAINMQSPNADNVESAVSVLKMLPSSDKVLRARVRGERGEINGHPYYMGRSGVIYIPEPERGMEFWGSVLDAADAAADRADAREISLITPLIHEAYNALLVAQKKLSSPSSKINLNEKGT